MLHSTKQKLYHNSTILIYVVLFIIAAVAILFGIFGVLIPGKQPYAAVKVSFYNNGSNYHAYFLVDDNDRVNGIAALDSKSYYITHYKNFKNYHIQDAVMRYYEFAIVTKSLDYTSNSSRTFNVAIYTTEKYEQRAKTISNSITETTNDYFKSINKVYSVKCSISQNLETVIYDISGINYNIEADNQLELDKANLEVLADLYKGFKTSKKYAPNQRKNYFVDSYKAERTLEEKLESEDKSVRKQAQKDYDDSIEGIKETNRLISRDYREENFNDKITFKEEYKQHTVEFNNYLDSITFEYTEDQMNSLQTQIDNYQKNNSVMYDLETGEIMEEEVEE